MKDMPAPEALKFNASTLQINGYDCWPNSPLPAIIYSPVPGAKKPVRQEVQGHLAANGYLNCWVWTIYAFHHFHTNTHEVLVCLAGNASVLLGGPKGKPLDLKEGMAVMIPAGLAHMRLEATADFAVLGAYPNGKQPNMHRGDCDDLEAALKQVKQVPLPEKDPILGTTGGTGVFWTDSMLLQ